MNINSYNPDAVLQQERAEAYFAFRKAESTRSDASLKRERAAAYFSHLKESESKRQKINEANQYAKSTPTPEPTLHMLIEANAKKLNVSKEAYIKQKIHTVLQDPEMKIQKFSPFRSREIEPVIDYSMVPMERCVIIPTTLKNGSLLKTIALGHALKIFSSNNPDHFNKFLNSLREISATNSDWVQEIRGNCFKDPSQIFCNTLLKIKECRPNERMPFLQTDYRLECYHLDNGALKLTEVLNENKSEVIRLFSSSVEGKKHYDLMYLSPDQFWTKIPAAYAAL